MLGGVCPNDLVSSNVPRPRSLCVFFFSSRRRHTRCSRDWSSDVCSSDLCPLFVVIALAIKLTSKGSIVFKQERVGRYGLRFKLLKFRSMKCVNDRSIHQEYVRRFIAGEADSARVDHNQNVVYKIQDDARVTRV